ncbi:head-tail adaptor protein [Labrenzia sp. PHM005]|uniref:head-tail adaptor protein n=1 Tax=Labrenzia sp. PHM005 TaxID=2590016 RepID=UPI001140412D|nr:head-tail adaptor protein [Labrenzia sp. PHM005]QDG78423.1 head-tail adaptor protein [Labrenzia sp. PHM005]
MRAGDYRLPIVLQRPVEVRATSGEVTLTFETAGTGFAALRLKSQAERFDGERLLSRKLWEIRLRPFSSLTGGWRIVSGVRVFRVLSVADPDGRVRGLVCDAEEEST